MAGDYGALRISVGADTTGLEKSIAGAAAKAGEAAGSAISASLGTAMNKMGGASTAVGKALGAIGGVAANALGGATIAATAFGVGAFKTAARVETLDVAMQAVGKNTEGGYQALQAASKAVKSMGIETGASMQTVLKFASAQLDVSKAADVARVAQDAAVIAGVNSTEATERITQAIITQQPELLRQYGLAFNSKEAFDKYGASVGKSANELSSAEKQQAIMNEVLSQGERIQGTYELSMTTAGKALGSFARQTYETSLAVGKQLLPAITPLILKLYDFSKAIADAVQPGGALAPVIASIGTALARLVEPAGRALDALLGWVKNLQPGQFEALASSIGKFAPQIAAVAAGLATFAGGNILKNVPLLGSAFGNLGGPMGALVAGIAVLVATTPELRDAFGDVVKALAPLLPALADAGKTLLATLVPALVAAAPLIVRLVEAIAPLVTAFPQATIGVIAFTAAWNPVTNAVTGTIGVLGKVGAAAGQTVGAFKAVAGAAGAMGQGIAAGANIAAAEAGFGSFGAMLSAKLAPAFAAVGTAARVAWTAITGPIGLAVIAIAAVVAAAIWAYNTFEPFREIVDQVAAAFVSFGKAVGTTAVAAFDAVKNAVGTVIDTFTNLWASFQTGVDIVRPIFERVADAITQPIQGVVQVVQGIVDLIVGIFTGDLDRVTTGVAEIIGGVVRTFLGLPSRVGLALAEFGPAILSVVGNALSAMGNAIDAGIGAAVSFLASLPGRAGAAISSLAGTLAGLAGAALSAMGNAISSGVASAVSFLAQLPGRAASAISALPGQLVSIGSSALSALGTAINSGIPAALSYLSSVPGRAVSAIGNLSGTLVSAGGDLLRGMASGITGAIGSVISAATDAAAKAVSAVKNALGIGSPSKVFRNQIGLEIPAGMALGIRAGTPDVQHAVEDLLHVPATLSADMRVGALGDGIDSRGDEVALLRQMVRLLAGGTTVEIDGQPVAAAVSAATLYGVAS